MKRIVLISCTSRKQTNKAKAKDLYKGPLFKNSLDFGQSFKPDKIFILSALHHLLDLNKVTEPYNVTLSYVPPKKRKNGLKILTETEKNEWGNKVIEQLKREADIHKDEFIVLAGKEYIKPIESYISNLKKPLENKKLGERIKFMQSKNKIC
jgi:hypothetical protein